jgi:hypothetical protein
MHNTSTSSFSLNVPESVLFSERLVSFSPYMSRLEEIDLALENIFAEEKYLSYVKQLQITNMQLHMDKIRNKYIQTPRTITPLDALRLTHFQERIDAIYAENEPTSEDFIQAELLMKEKEMLLNSL